MLPVIKVGVDEAYSARFMDILETKCREHSVRCRLEYTEEELFLDQEVEKNLDRIDGIGLYVIGGSSGRGTAEILSRLGRLIMRKNRDNYILYILPDGETIRRLLPYCVRPFGILVVPPDTDAIAAALDSMLRDYVSIVGEDAEDTSDTLVLQDGGVFFRIPIQDITLIEALNKKLIIHYGGEVLSVYGSIASLTEKLNEGFFRCHRSYLVNTKEIQRVDMNQMMLYLRNGEAVPVARSSRAELKSLLKTKKGASE